MGHGRSSSRSSCCFEDGGVTQKKASWRRRRGTDLEALKERGHRSRALITSEPEAPRGSFTSQLAPDPIRSEIVFSWEYSPARRRLRSNPEFLAHPADGDPLGARSGGGVESLDGLEQ